jgi:kumamolisin
LCASGDNGSTDGEKDKTDHVDFPGSSPWVTSCGGTRITVTNNDITDEVVWNDPSGGSSGGGISNLFSVPDYQQHVSLPSSKDGHIGRGVPDIAGDASPTTGYQCLVDKTWMTIGGTSAVAPLYAGMIARMNQGLGKRIGFFNPIIYMHIDCCRHITKGNNGTYQCSDSTYNCCCGLGSINGQQLYNHFKQCL